MNTEALQAFALLVGAVKFIAWVVVLVSLGRIWMYSRRQAEAAREQVRLLEEMNKKMGLVDKRPRLVDKKQPRQEGERYVIPE